MVGISDFGADCIAVTVPPSTAVLMTNAEMAATILAWVEMVFMFGPLLVRCDETNCRQRDRRKRAACDELRKGRRELQTPIRRGFSSHLQFIPAFCRFVAPGGV